MHFYMHSYLHKNFILVKSGCYKLGEAKCFHEDADGVLWFKICLVILKDFDLR
jgi:hypothetical protein